MRSTAVVCIVANAVLAFATMGFAQSNGAKSSGGATLPLATFSVSPSKVQEKKPLSVTIVGSNPFTATPSGSVIDAVIVPIIFQIGSVTFDPTAPDACDSGVSAINRFNWSPLVQPVPNLTFNGVNVGTAQYVDGFMRAEFWGATGGSPAYTNPINWSTAGPVTITTGANGIKSGSGCGSVGIVSDAFLDAQIASLLQTLTKSGVISAGKLVLFLSNYVVGSSTSPPTPPGTSACCTYAYHAVSGSQVYAFIEYPTLGGGGDVASAAHELAELMNDPLFNSSTPAWGAVGDVLGCEADLDVANPLTGIGNRRTITMNGYDYHLPEFAYFSWFFNAPGTPSIGAGGIFSSNGSFTGPSRACPPGGTY